MQVFNERNKTQITYLLKRYPDEIKLEKSHSAKYENEYISCLKCINPRCISYTKKEISKEIIKDFPIDSNTSVCPCLAISIKNDDFPQIDNEKCICCGLCIARCPVGAIYFKEDKVVVSTSPSKLLDKVDSTFESQQEKQLDKIKNTPKIGTYTDQEKEFIDILYSKLTGNNINLLVRNLLIELGNECQLRRVGDVYTRMDGIYKNSKALGSIEIEFSKDTLGVTRAVLDDIAMLSERYDIDKKNNSSLAICLQLPNNRQGYWQVVKDINNIEKLKINTISVAALLIILWNNRSNEFSNEQFYEDFDNESIRDKVEKIIHKKLSNIPIAYRGLLEPEK